MNIDSGMNCFLVNQAQARSSVSVVEKGHTNTSTAAEGGIKQADFSSMTRQDLREWTNNQILSGKMTLDESTPFMAMTMKIPVDGHGVEVSSAADDEHIDFATKAKLGIEAALQSNDPAAAKRLQVALEIMLRNQGQAIGVDIRA